MGLFGIDSGTKTQLRKLDTGESLAIGLSMQGVSTPYMIIRQDKLQELAEKAGYELVLK